MVLLHRNGVVKSSLLKEKHVVAGYDSCNHILLQIQRNFDYSCVEVSGFGAPEDVLKPSHLL